MVLFKQIKKRKTYYYIVINVATDNKLLVKAIVLYLHVFVDLKNTKLI